MGKNCILINQVKYEIKTYETIRSFFTANILISKYIHTANSRVYYNRLKIITKNPLNMFALEFTVTCLKLVDGQLIRKKKERRKKNYF